MPQGINKHRYKLIATHQDDKIIIEITGEKLHVIKIARDVLVDAEMLQGFSQKDAAMIGVVAGMALVI